MFAVSLNIFAGHAVGFSTCCRRPENHDESGWGWVRDPGDSTKI